QGVDRVAVTFTGDAGSNTGNFHEGLNMAAIWDLPVVFVLENNHYGVSTNIKDAIKIEDLSLRATGYGIPGVRVDGFDVLAVYQAAMEAVNRARRGDGPTLLVTESYRLEGHYAGEPEVYRSRSEVEEYRQKEPIGRFSRYLIENGLATPDQIGAVDAEIRKEIAGAIEFAKDSPVPDPATAMDYIYA
ncbi:MAG: pyruvate dehydrogenase (acetyl-transferring) E1 component subunit alpha, partial [Anaerolineaceae bacterium]|nr:pyruvate dehydrogenase (acetyl-transferring) E1 component subunit alpha [Anaerolineaceae bacterium]